MLSEQTRFPAIAVHGGAGHWEEGELGDAVEGCRAAAVRGLEVLREGGSALDAAIAAVAVLEANPLFNAGIGSCLSRDGTIEVDASVMDGTDLRFGAVAAMRDAYPAIEIARAVLDDGEHVLLCAEGAWAFARERGFAPRDLATERARKRLAREAERRAGGARVTDPGTVGAVAVDRDGRTGAATSTGGMTFKRAGRIGDTPLCGCGTYADDAAGAASATGRGESLIRVTATRHAVDLMRAGADAAAAADAAVASVARVGGDAGIICCDARGGIGAAHNTAAMPHAAGAVIASGQLSVIARARGEADLWRAVLGSVA